MIIDFLNKFDFFKNFLVIFNNIENNHKKDFILLAVKFLIATFLELFLIIFSGSLIYIILGDNNKEIIEVPKYLSSLGINEFNSIKFTILYIITALFSTFFSFYVKYEAIHVSNNISNHVNTNLIKSFLNIQYNKYTELSTDQLQLAAGYAQGLTKNILGYVDIIKGFIYLFLVSFGVYFTTRQNGLFSIFLLFVIYSLIVISTKKSFIRTPASSLK